MTAIVPALAGGNILYGMGLLEMGLSFSYAQLLVDCEIARMVRRLMDGITVNEETLAVDLIKSVGAGGHYLAEKHTMKHLRNEHVQVKYIDRKNRVADEEVTTSVMMERAKVDALKVLKETKAKPLDIETQKIIRGIIEEAEKEFKTNTK